MYTNYKILPIAPAIFKVLAWIGLSLGALSSLAIFIGGGTPQTPRWMGLVTLMVGIFYLFFFMVASEGIKLLLEIKDKIK